MLVVFERAFVIPTHEESIRGIGHEAHETVQLIDVEAGYDDSDDQNVPAWIRSTRM